MKKNYSKEFRVGIFALIGLFFLVGLGIFFNKDSFEKEGIKYFVVYSFLNGLQQGAPVKYAGGLTVGKILEIYPYGDKAKVKILVDSTIKITESTTFKIISAGLLGEKFINISLTSPPEEPKQEKEKTNEDELSSEEISIEDAKKKEPKIYPTLKENSIIIGSEDAGLDKLMESVSELAGKLTNMAVPLAQIFNQLSEDKAIIRIISDFKRILNSSAGILEDNRAQLKLTIKNINDILNKSSKGQGTIAKILNDREMANALKDTINSLKLLIDNLTRNPVLGSRSQKNGNNVKNFYNN